MSYSYSIGAAEKVSFTEAAVRTREQFRALGSIFVGSMVEVAGTTQSLVRRAISVNVQSSSFQPEALDMSTMYRDDRETTGYDSKGRPSREREANGAPSQAAQEQAWEELGDGDGDAGALAQAQRAEQIQRDYDS